MNASLVLTVIGPDRPGLVESIATVVAGHGGNWVESRLARLAGKFAGVLRVDVAPAHVAALTAGLRALRQQGLSVVVEPAAGDATDTAPPTLDLEFLGVDRPGIVREVSHALAQRRVNVIELHTECFSGAMSGERMFRAAARLHAPGDVPVEELRQTLGMIAQGLGLDVELKERREADP